MVHESRKLSFAGDPRRAHRNFGYSWIIGVFILAWLLGVNVEAVKGQSYLVSSGSPKFSTQIPVESGYIDASNGSLHFEIPVGSIPQRGGWQIVSKLMFETNVWVPGGGSWQPTNQSWGVITAPGMGDIEATYYEDGWCSIDNGPRNAHNTDWTWTAPDGTVRSFPISTEEDISSCSGSDIPNGAAFATDGSGFYMSVTNFGTGVVYAPDGTMLDTGLAYSTVISRDRNGNQF
jgi:hypothetical protein